MKPITKKLLKEFAEVALAPLYAGRVPSPGGLVKWDPKYSHYIGAPWVEFPVLLWDTKSKDWAHLYKDTGIRKQVVRTTCSFDDRFVFVGSVKADPYWCAVLIGETVVEVPILSIVKAVEEQEEKK